MKKIPPASLRLLIAIAASAALPAAAELPPFSGARPLEVPGDESAVPYLPPPPVWDRYWIQVWQFKTEVRRDLARYRELGFGAFHIDRGAGREDLVDFAQRENLPYYVDHAADKGLLHLTPRTGVEKVLKRAELVERPVSLSDPEVLATLRGHLDRNIAATKTGPVLAYSFDDEISLGSFNSPAEVDASPGTVALYREWLAGKYGEIARLNAAWDSNHADFAECEPISFEDLRRRHAAPPFSEWRLAPWMDWRAFMDEHFAGVLAGLTRHANSLDPAVPAGFVGAQQPSAYGGYDYRHLAGAVQFLEAYDIDGTNEILRSFWSWPQARPRVQTWFSPGDARVDRWFHGYYLLHGNRGAIAWPDTKGHGPWFAEGSETPPFLAENRDFFEEIQGAVSHRLFGGEARFEVDAVAVLYSMPSIRASWVTDVVPHGSTWPRRSSSLDNACQSAGKNRISWFKMLEDCGVQYQVVDVGQVAAGHLLEAGYRVLVLNRALCLSDAEAASIAAFAEAGGTVVADHWCGLLDENGNGRARGVLDGFFGIERGDDETYWGGGAQIWEINGENYQRPYLERLDYEGALRHGAIVRPERDRDALIDKRSGKGRAVYLNLSPVAYFDHEERFGEAGAQWREILGGLLAESGVVPVVAATAHAGDRPFVPVEVLRWDLRDGRELVGVVMNPSRQGAIDGIGEVGATGAEALSLKLVRTGGWRRAVNLRSGTAYADGDAIEIEWNPWDFVAIECDR